MTRIAFLGTPSAAVPSLLRLREDNDAVTVITQPDRPRGRSREPQPSPVKVAAVEMGLEVQQPSTSAELEAALANSAPIDVGIAVAYGRILRPRVLAVPRAGFLNVHFSLLPRWRGAAPVERAIMAGDTMSGVTIIQLDEGMDTGPVLTAQAVDIAPDETGGALTARLADLGGRLISNSLEAYLDGSLVPQTQTDEGAVIARKIQKEDRPIEIDGTAKAARDKVRALAPSPGATLRVDGEVFKILAVQSSEFDVEPGRWVGIEGWPVVGLSDGAATLSLIQPPGRSLQEGSAWLRGARRSGGIVE